jgi:membrane protease YdiL (CAAX protease family)
MSTEPDNETDDTDGDTGLDAQSARNLVVGLAIVVEGGLIAVAWLLGWLLEVPAFVERYEVGWKGVAWGLLAAAPMLAGFFVAVCYPVGPLRSIKRFTDEIVRPLMSNCTLLDLVGISVLAGLGEELLFRGVLQEAFRGGLEGPMGETAGVLTAVALSALLFGLLHAVTPSYAALAAVMGAYLGLVFHYTDNLLTVIVAHAAYDLVALVWLTRGPGSEAPEDEEDEEEGEDESGQE